MDSDTPETKERPFREELSERAGPVTAKEARESLSRFNASHFRTRDMGEQARYSIPANPKRDDDIRLGAYITQTEKLAEENAALKAQIEQLTKEPAELGYAHGLETVEPCDGFAIFTGKDGEDPSFAAFFLHREDADAALASKDESDDGAARYFDACITEAVLTEGGIIAANDFEIKDHTQLRERIAAAKAGQL